MKTPTSLDYGKRLFLCLLPLVFLIASSATVSFPRLAAEHAHSCKGCHINPTGGGARSEFGNHAVALQELTLIETKKYLEPKYRKPRVSDAMLVGFDVRFLAFDQGLRLFRMQTDFYTTLSVFDRLHYHMRFSEVGIDENYGIFWFGDEKHYIRAGRFYPSFGLRNDDHTSYNRVGVGMAPRLFLDGVSVGVDVADINAAVEAFNPNEQTVVHAHVFRTTDAKLFSFLLGLSGRFSEELVVGSYGAFQPAKAVFGSVSLDRFTLSGEFDLVGEGNDALILYGALYARVIQGLWTVAEYNFYDPERRSETGADEFYRLSVELYPIPFVLVRPSYTIFTEGTLDGTNDFFVQFHVGY